LSFSVPSTATLERAPHETGCQPRPGSAHRLSQPLSGFQANPSFAALFHAATVPGIPPSESSPRRSRAPLSRPLAPLQLSTDVLNRAARDLITARFTDSHAFTQLPGSPDDYELPFVAPERTLPGHPGSQPPEPIRSASFTCFEAFFLLRVRSHWIGLPLTSGRSSLEFQPLQSLSIHASDPVTRSDPRSDLAPELPPRNATQRTLRPSEPGEHRPIQSCIEQSSSAASDPLRDQPVSPHR
jgi:hypothetical protein